MLGLLAGAGMCLFFRSLIGIHGPQIRTLFFGNARDFPLPLSWLPADMLVAGLGFAVAMVILMSANTGNRSTVREYAWSVAGGIAAVSGIGAVLGAAVFGWFEGLEFAIVFPAAAGALIVALGSLLAAIFGSAIGLRRWYLRRGRPIWPEAIRRPLRPLARFFSDED
jgi:hypothetical protein